MNDKGFLVRDFAIVALSVLVAVILVNTGAVNRILTSTQELELFGSFVAGIFFTSVFTTAPAIVTLAGIAEANSIWPTAFFGALGAVVGDLLIFNFIKDQLSVHVKEFIAHANGRKRMRAVLKKKYFRWFTFLLGGLIIASPLPDELGVSLLGFSKMKTALFIPLSFIFNFIGILLIGLAARAFGA